MMVSRTAKQSSEMVYVNGDEDQNHSVEYMEFDKIAQSYGMPIAKVLIETISTCVCCFWGDYCQR